MPKLTKKQQDFADEYVKTGNGRQSALKAYNTEDGNTAGAIASENLTKPNIKKEIEDQTEKIKAHLTNLAFSAEKEQQVENPILLELFKKDL